MTLVIESIEIDSRITKRISPMWKVVAVCMNMDVARWTMLSLQAEYNKQLGNSTAIINDELFINNDGYKYMRKKVFLKEEPLYGSKIINNKVYCLILERGYIYDKDYPYGCIHLGWFTDLELVKATKEWQFFQNKIKGPRFTGFESMFEIAIDPWWMTDHYPRLYIQPFILRN